MTREEVQTRFQEALDPLYALWKGCRDKNLSVTKAPEAGSEDDLAHREIVAMEGVAKTLINVFEEMARPEKSPGPFAVAEAVRTALVQGNVERAANGGGRVYGPTRRGLLNGLNGLIEERSHQLKGLAETFTRLCPGEYIDTSPAGVACAHRKVLRERDAFVAARDHA